MEILFKLFREFPTNRYLTMKDRIWVAPQKEKGERERERIQLDQWNGTTENWDNILLISSRKVLDAAGPKSQKKTSISYRPYHSVEFRREKS